SMGMGWRTAWWWPSARYTPELDHSRAWKKGANSALPHTPQVAILSDAGGETSRMLSTEHDGDLEADAALLAACQRPDMQHVVVEHDGIAWLAVEAAQVNLLLV